MDGDDRHQRTVFEELHKDLPREAPGSSACTRRALGLCVAGSDATASLQVLDLGCGPGAQTVDLATELPGAHIVALDLHGPYLGELRRRCRRAGVVERVSAVQGDLARLPLRRGGWDLIWCEGAAYIIGVAAALDAWRGLLRPGGRLAFTDAVWLTNDPPAAARAFWTEYPDMTDLDTRRAQISAAGWRLLGDFVLPPEAWCDGYYEPLAARIARLRARYAGDTVAEAVLDAHQIEIDTFRRYGDSYGYAFFVVAPG